MRLTAIAILLSLVAVSVCTVDARLTATNSCCQPCSMEDGAPSCDCCRLSTPDFPSLIAAKSVSFEPSAIVAVLPSLVDLLPTNPVSASFTEPGKPVRDHSPPKLYLLHASFLI